MDVRQMPPGKRLLRVAGIMMIVYGVGAIGSGVASFIFLVTELPLYIAEQVDKRTMVLVCGLGLVGVVQFIAGIVGVRNCGKLKKGSTCFVWGIIATIFSVIGIILLVLGEADPNDVPGLYVLLIVPLIPYLIGSVWNRNDWNRVRAK